jgi:HicB-like protein involved in pilus formation
MSSLSLRLPESLHQKIRELAERDEISINQFIATAVAEKAAALLTVAYLEERGRQGGAQLFDRVLARVPDGPPAPGDELLQPRRRKAPKPESPTHRAAKPRKSRTARG